MSYLRGNLYAGGDVAGQDVAVSDAVPVLQERKLRQADAFALITNLEQGTIMSEWRPIETCPENTWVLVGRTWAEPPEDVSVDRFQWATEIEEEVESESSNAKGRRKIIQEHHRRVRRWESGGAPDLWMPKPELPHS